MMLLPTVVLEKWVSSELILSLTKISYSYTAAVSWEQIWSKCSSVPALGDGSMGASIQMQITTALLACEAQMGRLWVRLHGRGWLAFPNPAGKSLLEVPRVFQVPLSGGT